MGGPWVLFVCEENGGRAQVAAALMRHLVGDRIAIYSAGEYPEPIDPHLLDTVDRVVILGADSVVDHPGSAPIAHWDTEEPSNRGINGAERMRLVRDDIDGRVIALGEYLTA